MSKKLKPLTIFLSDDELVNFKSHFDEFLNMNCDDKIKEQQQEIERLNKELEIAKDNEETYRLEMLDITKRLGLDEETLFDEVKDKAERLNKERKTDIKYNKYLQKELAKSNNIIKELKEYITSYESISTIQGLEDIEINKDLDEKTLNEMIRRYMIVHDKLLEILNKGE